jgi:hypothetical protein
MTVSACLIGDVTRRPIADDDMAVGVTSDGAVGIILPDGSAPFEMGPNTAMAMGQALIAAAQAALDIRAAALRN